MHIEGEAQLLRIFLGESDHLDHQSLYEYIVMQARKQGLAGATVWRGIMGFGGRSRQIHTSKILRLSEDLPIVIEIVDESQKIQNFLPFVNEAFDRANCGGLVTVEEAEVIRYIVE
ncbi:MAG TPA: DUF190 domain-containing protein [bacterium]|nr:DUF190 domain-containing protein [bacterium]